MSDWNNEDLELVEELTDDEVLKWYITIIKYLVVSLFILASLFFLLGLVAIFYNDKAALVAFGFLCILHLIGAPMGYCAIKLGNKHCFLALAILNILWIAAVLLLFIIFFFVGSYFVFFRLLSISLYLSDLVSGPKKEEFKGEIALHVGAFVYIPLSITVATLCFLVLLRLNQLHAPDVKGPNKGTKRAVKSIKNVKNVAIKS